ncbi:hypothetical protein A4G20_07850 [Pasteurellaceae bacterium RH1A]|nr:hypothetical protein A4G20_07850 [Pasteurellaceae bacterium RH1A]
MNKITKLSLSLITSLVLSACGGSGGGSSQSQAAPINSAPTEKAQEKQAPKQALPNTQKEEAQPEPMPKESEESALPPVKEQENPTDKAPLPKEPEAHPNPEQAPSPSQGNEDIKPEKPVKPMVEDRQPEPMPQSYNDQEVLKELSLDHEAQPYLTLTLNDDKKVALALAKADDKLNHITRDKVETLRDSQGNLVGYYGYALVNHLKQNEDEPDKFEGLAPKDYYLFSADERQKHRPETQATLHYEGKMFYRYNEDNLTPKTAEVFAQYKGENKTASMWIKDGANRWYLTENRVGNLKAAQREVDVSEDGVFSGHLLHDKTGEATKVTPDGNFVGGFYGSQGDVLVGEANGLNWKGVVGATVKQEEK